MKAARPMARGLIILLRTPFLTLFAQAGSIAAQRRRGKG